MPIERFLIAGLTLVLIDLLLAGDNALVIAMAVRQLPSRQRRIASFCGASLAVVLRVGLTFIAAEVLAVRFVKLGGGIFILWIAFQVLRDASEPPAEASAQPRSLWRAMWYVVVADLTMSIDNILAIAGASEGNIWLIVFGLAVSIPFVVMSSNLLVNLMNKHPLVIWVGSAILGKVGGDMALTDPWVAGLLHPSALARYAVDAGLIALILIAGRIAARNAGRHSPA